MLPIHIVLASASDVRAMLLRSAGLDVAIDPARVDEESIKSALVAEGARPRDIADTLAEHKARQRSSRHSRKLVLGCDQVLHFQEEILSKPLNVHDCKQQIMRLSGHRHELLSAAVLYDNGAPIWRHVGIVTITMRPLSQTFVEDYVGRNWHSISNSLGGYKLEEEGVRLVENIKGDYFHVLGLPLLELLNFFHQRGDMTS